MLTSVLVETSAALHSANVKAAASTSGQHPAEVVQAACEQMEEVADYQAEILGSHLDFDDAAQAAAVAASGGEDMSGDTDALARLAQMAANEPVAESKPKSVADTKPKAPPPNLPEVPISLSNLPKAVANDTPPERAIKAPTPLI